MKKSYSLGTYEFIVVIIAIAIILMVAAGRYVALAEDARNLRFEVISHHFMKGVADARVQWILKRQDSSKVSQKKIPISIGNYQIYFSQQAWPAAIRPFTGDDFVLGVDDCYALWMSFLQNPAPITKEGVELRGTREYHLDVVDKACRYYLVTSDPSENYFFEYYPLDGRVLLTVPDVRHFNN